MLRFLDRDGEGVVIRPALPRDAEGFILTLDSVCREGEYMLHESVPHSVEDERRLIKTMDMSRNLIAVVEIDQIIVGGMSIYVGGSSPKSQFFCNLGLHLIKEVREKGIGHHMMDYGIRWAHQRPFHKMCLSVLSTNIRAIHLYRKFGFVVEGIRKEQFRIGNQYVDEILMARFLD